MKESEAVIRRADSQAVDVFDAIRELNSTLQMKEASLTIFFCDIQYCNEKFSRALAACSGDSTIVGCTTAGEIGLEGYLKKSIVAVSFPKSSFRSSAHVINGLKEFTVDQARNVAEKLKNELCGKGVEDCRDCFALLLIDGMSVAEEPLTYRLQEALGEIPLIGGSAGDDARFIETNVFFGGEFSGDAAVVVLVHSQRPWEVFKEQHFRASETKMVVTEADPENRRVQEINGEPAAEVYAGLLGLKSSSELKEKHFAKNPFMLRTGNTWYLRSPQKVNDDGSLSLYCAVDRGMVLFLGKGVNLVKALDAHMEKIRSRINPISLTIACDCIQRRIELEDNNELDEASKVLAENNAIGFNTYGEQFGVHHINQTLTGIVIG